MFKNRALFPEILSGIKGFILFVTALILLVISHVSLATQGNLNHSLVTLNDQQLLLSQKLSTDKPIYLKFWASWCQPCLKEMPHLQHSYEAYSDEVQIVAVNIDINETNKDIENVINKFGLTVPILKDSSGSLAKEMKFVGTPYHILIDETGEIVHKGHEANEKLDRKMAVLAQGDAKLQSITLESATDHESILDLNDGQIHALYFTATWCDWYLQDSRPEMSENCIAAQHKVNELAKKGGFNWQVITSHLWTGEEEIAKYRDKYGIEIPVLVDPMGDAFFKFKVKEIPTLLLIKDGKVLSRSRQPASFNNLVAAHLNVQKDNGTQ